MTYDPTLASERDRIRLALGDTSNDADTEILPDVTYDALLDAYDDWLEAAVVIGEATLTALERDEVKSYTQQGDFAVTFRDPHRIRQQIADWRAALAEAAAEAAYGGVLTITADVMTDGAEEWTW